MRPRPLLSVLALALASLAAWPCAAQTLSSRPVLFADPVLSTDPSAGELVLGRTTLTTVLRIFAAELEDSIQVPLRHRSNPDTVFTGMRLPGVPDLRLYYRLYLGPTRYTLYFDRNERLVAAMTDRSRIQRPLRREELVARYPTLKVAHIGRTAEGVWIRDELAAPLGPCVSFTADLWRRDKGQVGTFGYVYTCSTRPAPQKAVLDREP
jgi:hypothetical protein